MTHIAWVPPRVARASPSGRSRGWPSATRRGRCCSCREPDGRGRHRRRAVSMRCFPVGDRAVCGEVIELHLRGSRVAGAGVDRAAAARSPTCRSSAAGGASRRSASSPCRAAGRHRRPARRRHVRVGRARATAIWSGSSSGRRSRTSPGRARRRGASRAGALLAGDPRAGDPRPRPACRGDAAPRLARTPGWRRPMRPIEEAPASSASVSAAKSSPPPTECRQPRATC